MQLTLPMSSGRTSPESSIPKTTPLDASSLRWWEQMPHSCRHENRDGGVTQVWLLAPEDRQRGEFSTLNISASPSEGGGSSSLSAVLEEGPVPPRYYLSAKAASGILRRAESRGKELPPALEEALRGTTSGSGSTAPQGPPPPASAPPTGQEDTAP